MKRVLVLINKWWECDAALVPMFDRDARPKDLLPWPDHKDIHHPRKRQNPSEEMPPSANVGPRVIFRLPNLTAEIWCISDLLEHLPDTSAFQSSSYRKVEALDRMFAAAQPPDLTIAVGTATMADAASWNNGSVVVGTEAYLYNPYSSSPNKESPWTNGPFGQVLTSTFPEAKFNDACTGLPPLSQYFLSCGKVDGQRFAFPDARGVAVSDVNVTDFKQYEQFDKQAVDTCRVATSHPILSVETTHGVIRSVSGPAFMFVSGISNRMGHFGDEVGRQGYSQTFPAAHNAGLIVAGVLSGLDRYWRN
jgi:hypothetical protein